MNDHDVGFVSCLSGKRAFATERDALDELDKLVRRGEPKERNRGRVERRAYRCNVLSCNAWHLTSQRRRGQP